MSMDIEKLTILRDTILAHPGGFNMMWWGATDSDGSGRPTPEQLSNHMAGATACIGGWAAALFYPERERLASSQTVMEVLGLTDDQREGLFFPGPADSGSPYKTTADQAARVLDHLIETGTVDWNKAFA